MKDRIKLGIAALVTITILVLAGALFFAVENGNEQRAVRQAQLESVNLAVKQRDRSLALEIQNLKAEDKIKHLGGK